MNTIRYVAPCLLGIEGLVADEFNQMGALGVEAVNGRVLFSGDERTLVRANLWSRFSERILVLMGSFRADSFDRLFEQVKALPWEEFIGAKDTFPVKGWSINSKLHSIPDCQSIIKKAVVERLKSRYQLSWFEETGPVYQIQFSIMKDTVSLMIDTSGPGLHKRGYRPAANEAPLKETLAASMAYLARLYDDSTVYDPFCGSGTILIESILLAGNIAPGLRRGFAAERWKRIPAQIWQEERQRAMDSVKKRTQFRAVGSDLDPKAVALTELNAKRAGVRDKLDILVRDVRDFTRQSDRGIVICNPPYGERLLDIRQAEEIYKTMGKVFEKQPGWSYNVISAHEHFEDLFGRAADRRRKLYNGMIKCQYFMYYKR